MLTLEGIKVVMAKLNAQEEDGKTIEGEVRFDSSRGNENRYSYYYKNQLVFTFGITRSSRKKSKVFHYVPRQMHLQLYTITPQHLRCPRECYD
ncbi:MAG: hypothetical protein QME81_13700, partial [bacterium]|nr:hypothetical protein [bacterium]